MTLLWVLLWLAATGGVAWQLRQPRLPYRRAVAWLCGGLLLALACRYVQQPDWMQNMDTAAWLSGMISTVHAPNPFYTLATHTDGRPLTVAPLLPFANLPLDYRQAALLGVLMWAGTAALLFHFLGRHSGYRVALGLSWVLVLLVGTTVFADFMAYNSEHPAVLLLTLCLWRVGRLARDPAPAAGGLAVVGVLLGLVPFVKFQGVPLALCLAAFVFYGLLHNRRPWPHLLLLACCGLLPAAALLACYAAWGEVPAFWNDYFQNYAVYSYTTEVSGVSVGHRFHPAWIQHYIFSGTNGVLFAGLTLTCVATLIAAWRQKPLSAWLIFGAAWVLAAFYAVLQAGNLYYHYLLFLPVPLLTATGLGLESLPEKTKKALLYAALLTAAAVGLRWQLQGTGPHVPTPQDLAAPLLGREVARLTPPGEPLLLWGYADDIYVQANRPAATRLSHTFWAYWKSSTQAFRQQEWLADARRSNARVFVHLFVPGYALPADLPYGYQHFGPIRQYIDRHYRFYRKIAGADVYLRRDLPTPASAPSPRPEP